MNTIKTLSAGLVSAALLVSATAYAHEGFEHPAVIAKRAETQQTYDYASQFYAHPAGLALSAEAPHTMNQHPAVTIAKRAKEARQYDYSAQFYAHPAGLALAGTEAQRAPALQAAVSVIAR